MGGVGGTHTKKDPKKKKEKTFLTQADVDSFEPMQGVEVAALIQHPEEVPAPVRGLGFRVTVSNRQSKSPR